MATILGTEGADALRSTAAGDVIYGFGGDDALRSLFNRTTIFGGDGADRIFAQTLSPMGVDDLWQRLRGGLGDDVITGRAHNLLGATARVTLFGDGGDDVLRGGTLVGDDGAALTQIAGGGGRDQITATAVGDQFGDARNDVRGGWGGDTVVAEAFGGRGINVLRGEGGDDAITAVARSEHDGPSLATNTLYGGVGHDRLDAFAETGSNAATGTANNVLFGEAGDDALMARIEDRGANTTSNMTNVLDGGAGDDTARAEIDVADQPDGVFVFVGRNVLRGLDGDDALSASAVVVGDGRVEALNDLSGGAGDDVLRAFAEARLVDFSPSTALSIARNVLDGGVGDDVLTGEIGGPVRIGDDVARNVLIGGDGDDRLTAIGGERNVLDGGAGSDRARGAFGSDTFVFDRSDLTDGEGLDVLFAFDPSRDRLAFSGFVDRGAAGLVDDLDAISDVVVGPAGAIVAFRDAQGDTSDTLFRLLDRPGADSVADLVADPATQIVNLDPGLLA